MRRWTGWLLGAVLGGQGVAWADGPDDAAAVVDAALAQLRNGDAGDDDQASYRLSDLGAAGAPFVPRVAAILADSSLDGRARIAALAALWPMATGTPAEAAALAALIAALDDSDGDVVHVASETVMNIGPRAWTAVPALLRRLAASAGELGRDAYDDRTYAVAALASVARTAEAAPLLRDAFARGGPALRALVVRGVVHRAAVPLLEKALRDPDAAVRAAATEQLGELTDAPDLALPILEGLLASGGEAAESARYALSRLGAPGIRRLVDEIVDPAVPEAQRVASAGRLVHLDWGGRSVDAAVALELARAFDRGSAAVRVQLAEVFPETAQGGAVTLPILLRHVGDAELAVRRACATAINIILASDAEARAGIASKYVAAVARALASGDAEDRARVARAWVVSVDGDELNFLRPSLSALSGTDPAARTDAAWRILGAVLATSMSEAGAPRASTAPAELLPVLTASLAVDGEHVGPAVQALGWLGSRSRDALPALDALLKRPGGARHSADVAAAKRRILGR